MSQCGKLCEMLLTDIPHPDLSASHMPRICYTKMKSNSCPKSAFYYKILNFNVKRTKTTFEHSQKVLDFKFKKQG